MALEIFNKRELKHIDIYVESQLIVSTINHNLIALNPQLDQLVHWIHGVLRGLDSYQVFHVQCTDNMVADDLENKGCHLGKHKLSYVGRVDFF